MNNPKIVSREEWIETQRQFLAQEKESSEHHSEYRGRCRVIRVAEAMEGGQERRGAYQADNDA
jgi:predicted dithiol-disulfide oxidoreductase (DUF899 family)